MFLPKTNYFWHRMLPLPTPLYPLSSAIWSRPSLTLPTTVVSFFSLPFAPHGFKPRCHRRTRCSWPPAMGSSWLEMGSSTSAPPATVVARRWHGGGTWPGQARKMSGGGRRSTGRRRGRRHDRVGGAAPPRPPSGGEDRGYMDVSCTASSFTFGWAASAACMGA